MERGEKAASWRQRSYYARTAAEYDLLHGANADPEHEIALRYATYLASGLAVRTLLDVGSGTGRVLAHFHGLGLEVCGVEPVPEMIEEGTRRHGLPDGAVVQGYGHALPFASHSFDAVSAFGVLHHVARPAGVVSEMLRVARYLVLISDSNRFGQGAPAVRLAKLLLARLGLWPVTNAVRTGGRGYSLSEGDGLSYSYSVFDSLDAVGQWADRVILVPTDPAPSGRGPLLGSGHVLLCGVRER